MKKKFLFIVFLTVGCLLFLYFTNDHKECENHMETFTNSQGEVQTLERHLCRERFAI